MYTLFVDESGDPGKGKGASVHFILTGIAVPASHLKTIHNSLVSQRTSIQREFGFKSYLELHACEMIRVGKTKEIAETHKRKRIKILTRCAAEFPSIFEECHIIAAVGDKQNCRPDQNILRSTWNELLKKYNAFLQHKDDVGMLTHDTTDNVVVHQLFSEMQFGNKVSKTPQYMKAECSLVGGPQAENSQNSLFLQSADLAAYLLYKKLYPQGRLDKFNINRLFDSLAFMCFEIT